MNDVRLIEVSLAFGFEPVEGKEKVFSDEYLQLSENEDPITQWYRTMKIKSDVSETDPVVLNLLLELHRKIDRLEAIISGTPSERASLSHDNKIVKMGFEHFELSEPLLNPGASYYGRVVLPNYTRHEIPFYFEAVTETMGHINRIHTRDEAEWSGYMMARERAMIRYMKGLE